jgi:lipopolysaccharide/colanic/teichoic acid biosynthesis glycosyltransferase
MKRFLKSRRLTAILIFLDAAAFSGIWLGSYYLRDALARRGVINLPINEVSNYVLALKVYLPLWLAVIWHYGLYDHREKITGLNQVSSILRALIAGSIFSLAVAYLFKPWDLGRFVLILTPPLYALWLYASRSWLRAWKQRQILRGVGVTNVLIIGVGRTARRVKERIVNHPEGGYRIVGFVDPHPRRRLTEIDGIPVLGRTSKIVDILARHEVDVAFLAVPHMPQNEIMNLVVQCEHSGVPFKIVSNLFEVITSQVRIDVIDEVPVVHLKNAELPWLQRLLKRILDVVVASVLLVMFAIPMLIFAIIIKLDSPGPVLFRHRRVGKGGRLFTMYKFRTMRTQLINVLLGDMSMVGPRPEMPFIVERYEEWQKRRLDVKPGVTGLWQIVGRKNLPLALNLEYDFYYIKNQSLFFDIVILIKTIPAVVFGKGAF